MSYLVQEGQHFGGAGRIAPVLHEEHGDAEHAGLEGRNRGQSRGLSGKSSTRSELTR